MDRQTPFTFSERVPDALLEAISVRVLFDLPASPLLIFNPLYFFFEQIDLFFSISPSTIVTTDMPLKSILGTRYTSLPAHSFARSNIGAKWQCLA